MKIKIIKAQNSLLWYARHIGEEFEVCKQEKNSYWILEKDTQYRLLNWVHKEDAQLVVKD